MKEFKPFEDPVEVEKILEKREELIQSLQDFTITEDEIAQAEAHLITCFDSFSASR